MSRVAVATVTGLATLAACFIKPDRPGANDDGGPGDTNDASGPLACIRDDFNTAGSACGMWGSGSGTLIRNAGELYAEVTTGLDVSGCQSTNFNFGDPVALKIR